MDFFFALGSPAARKVRIYLAEKAAELTEHEQYRGFLPVEDIAPLNPCLTIPVLYDGDLRLYDSQIMVAYILEKYPSVLNVEPPLLPTVVRGDHKWRDANLLAALQTMSVSLEHIHVLGTLHGLSDEAVPYLVRERTRVDRLLDWLDGQATPEGFAPGWFSLMDVMFIVHIQFSETRNGLQWRGRRNLERLVDAFADRPSVARTAYPWMT